MTDTARGGNAGGKLTGRRVLAIFVGCFAVVIAANVTLMVSAIDTFSGLVVPNSYVASQSFDANRRAQEALGWQVGIDYRGGAFRITMKDAEGGAVRPRDLRVTLGRATTEAQDHVLALSATPAGYVAPVDLAPGRWRVDIVATAENGASFVQYRALFVPARS